MSNRETLEIELNNLPRQLNNLQVQQQRIQERIPAIILKLADTASPRNRGKQPTRDNAEAGPTKANKARTPAAERIIDGAQVVQPQGPRE